MKSIKKISNINNEISTILENILKQYDESMILSIIKNLGYNEISEISNNKDVIFTLKDILEKMNDLKKSTYKTIKEETEEEETEEEETEEEETEEEETEEEETEEEETEEEYENHQYILSFSDFIKEHYYNDFNEVEDITEGVVKSIKMLLKDNDVKSYLKEKNIDKLRSELENEGYETDEMSDDEILNLFKDNESVNEAARVGRSSWKSVLRDLQYNKWETEGDFAYKYFDTKKDKERLLKITCYGNEIEWVLYDDNEKQLDSGSFDAEGLSADELDVQLWNYIDESKVNEAEIKSDKEFKEYANKVLKNAFKDDYDETKADDVINGLIDKYKDDYGAMVGALKNSL